METRESNYIARSRESLPAPGRAQPLRILLVKPYQPAEVIVFAPPLGLLHLVSQLRQRFGEQVVVRVVDMKAQRRAPALLVDELRDFQPDVVGLSALNVEAAASEEICQLVKRELPEAITVLGGPYALNRSQELLQTTTFDWIFSGAADNSFPEALRRLLAGEPLGADIPGFSRREADGRLVVNTAQDTVSDLDALPLPAWDLVDFDVYATQPNMNGILKGRRYATLFTSRGCPYLCNYCHDLFSKKFYYRSVQSVIAEIELLYETYGVDEFEIVDDIFNLHKPRLKAIMTEVARRWPGKIKFCFPNGLRADILDTEVLDALAAGGTYMVTLAIETVTPRLQQLIEKDLDLAKTERMIEEANKRGMIVSGFFMLGFPTESAEEVQATLDFACRSRLAIANFFLVVPQPATPLYELAMKENAEATLAATRDHESGGDYRAMASWYERAYNIPLNQMIWRSALRFWLSPWRIVFLARKIPLRQFLVKARNFYPYLVKRMWYPSTEKHSQAA